MALRITHIWPRLEIHTTRAEQQLEQIPARLEIATEPARTEMVGEPFRVEINQYPCFAEAGLKNVFDLTREESERARQQLLEGIARRAQEGDGLAAIERKGNPLVEQALEIANPPPAEFNIAFIPQSRPEITIHGGKKLLIEPGKITFSFQPGSVTYDFRPGQVEIYLAQKAELQIEFTGNTVDISI